MNNRQMESPFLYAFNKTWWMILLLIGLGVLVQLEIINALIPGVVLFLAVFLTYFTHRKNEIKVIKEISKKNTNGRH